VAKIVDPDQLNQATEVVISTAAKTIQLLVAGNLSNSSPGSTSGVTLQALYSFLKEEWKSDNALNKFRFPIQMFTKTDGQFINGWAFADATSRTLVRDAGWTEGSSIYAGIISLGSFDSTGDQAYYAQDTAYNATDTDFDKSGNLNEAVDITGATAYIKSFLRIQGKTYSEYRLVEEQGLSALEPVLYRQPLANAPDIDISEIDANIDSNAPYTGMKLNYLAGSGFTTAAATTYATGDVVMDGTGRWAFCSSGGTVTTPGGAYASFGGTSTWEAYDGERQIGANYYAFNRLMDANGGTAEEIYNWLQRQLRQTSDINADDSTTADQRSGLVMNGTNAELLAFFVGDNLHTRGGLFIDNFDVNSTNNLTFGDITVDGGGVSSVTHLPVTTTDHTYPFVAAGTLEFSANLVSEPDADTRYTMYFTNANGNTFDSSSAIIVKDNSGTDIDGQITAAAIAWDFDYDNNVQGGRTQGTDAGVTVVAQGLNGAQWVLATATITRTTGQSIPVNANDERNYSNPV
jgi:hypothetical protein